MPIVLIAIAIYLARADRAKQRASCSDVGSRAQRAGANAELRVVRDGRRTFFLLRGMRQQRVLRRVGNSGGEMILEPHRRSHGTCHYTA